MEKRSTDPEERRRGCQVAEHIEEKAGRHTDDFLVQQARDTLNIQDAVRLHKTGDKGRLLAMNIRKLELPEHAE